MFVVISLSNSGGFSKLAVSSEINSLLSGHPGHSNKGPTITRAPPPLLNTISKRPSARCGSEETPVFVPSRLERKKRIWLFVPSLNKLEKSLVGLT